MDSSLPRLGLSLITEVQDRSQQPAGHEVFHIACLGLIEFRIRILDAELVRNKLTPGWQLAKHVGFDCLQLDEKGQRKSTPLEIMTIHAEPNSEAQGARASILIPATTNRRELLEAAVNRVLRQAMAAKSMGLHMIDEIHRNAPQILSNIERSTPVNELGLFEIIARCRVADEQLYSNYLRIRVIHPNMVKAPG